MDQEQEIEFMRGCRRMGLLPNPERLTGKRKALALEMEALFKRVDEIDVLIDEGSSLLEDSSDSEEGT